MRIASLHEFLEAGCELQRPSRWLFVALYHSTRGRPCDDCVMRVNCKQRHDLELAHNARQAAMKKPVGETNAQIAKRLGISPRQVSKRRKAGRL